MIKIFNELKRRNVIRVAGLYAVVAWLLMQISTQLEGALHLPTWFDTLITTMVLLGFPVALILAWAFEMTPEGVKRTRAATSVKTDSEEATPRNVFFGGVAIFAVTILFSIWFFNPFSPDKNGSAQAPVESAKTESTQLQEASNNDKPSIAVLPFEDFSQSSDQAYFANGISEELLNVLARIKGLRVASRTSAFSFQGSGADTGTIAGALNVGHILEGSIRKSGTTLRITAQLIDASSDQHLWSDTYDRPLTAENLFEIQDEIASAIVAELKGRLSLEVKDVSSRTTSLEAYQLYLRARENMAQRLPDTLRAAIIGFEQAIELDPKFAPAYAGLAETYLVMPGYADVDESTTITKARLNIQRALALSPDSAESLTAASLLASEEGRYKEAIELASKAIEINPNFVPAYHRRGSAYGALGQNKNALVEFEKAEKLDPLSSVILTNLGAFQLGEGDLAAARATNEKNIRFNPTSVFGYTGLAGMEFMKGDYLKAHGLLKDAQALNPESVQTNSMLNAIYTSVGLFELGLALPISPNERAIALLASGQYEEAKSHAVDTPNLPNAVYFFLGDSDKSYAAMREWITNTDFLSKPISSHHSFFLVMCAMIFEQKSDPDARALTEKLERYFDAKTPDSLTNAFELEAGGFMQILLGKPESSYAWFDRYLDLGFARAGIVNYAFPGTTKLRGDDRWLEIEARYEANAEALREQIQLQLDNPEPNWLK